MKYLSNVKSEHILIAGSVFMAAIVIFAFAHPNADRKNLMLLSGGVLAFAGLVVANRRAAANERSADASLRSAEASQKSIEAGQDAQRLTLVDTYLKSLSSFDAAPSLEEVEVAVSLARNSLLCQELLLARLASILGARHRTKGRFGSRVQHPTPQTERPDFIGQHKPAQTHVFLNFDSDDVVEPYFSWSRALTRALELALGGKENLLDAAGTRQTVGSGIDVRDMLYFPETYHMNLFVGNCTFQSCEFSNVLLNVDTAHAVNQENHLTAVRSAFFKNCIFDRSVKLMNLIPGRVAFRNCLIAGDVVNGMPVIVDYTDVEVTFKGHLPEQIQLMFSKNYFLSAKGYEEWLTFRERVSIRRLTPVEKRSLASADWRWPVGHEPVMLAVES